MSNFLKLLPMDLDRITEFIEPQDEIDSEDEEVIGDMSEEHKQLFTKAQKLTEEIFDHLGSSMIPDMSKLMQMKNRGDVKGLEEFMETAKENFGKGNEMRAKTGLILALLDILVKDEYSLWGPMEDVGFRKGFKIVKYQVM